MAFLYTFLNIILPLSLLSYLTFSDIKKKIKVRYGQWFLIINIMVLFNILFTLFRFTWVMFAIDLAAKLVIIVIPEKMNNDIEQKISDLHLQVFVEIIRSKAIGRFFKVHCSITKYLLGKMNDLQAKEFKNTLIQRLNHISQTPQGDQNLQRKIRQSYKKFHNVGVGCSIDQFHFPLKPQIVQFKKKVQSSLGKSKDKRNQVPPSPPRPNIKPQIIKTIPLRGYQQSLPPKPQFKVYSTYNDSHAYFSKNKQDKFPAKPQEYSQQINSLASRKTTYQPHSAYQNLKSQRISYPNDPPVNFQKQSKLSYEIAQSKISLNQSPRKQQDPDEILQNLDVQVSQYSIMFQDEEQFNKSNNDLVCKVQAIVQIGTSYSTRLQFYNLELYQNGDLRIVSSYGRQFERNKLLSMKPLDHNYYDLYFAGGKKRKVKFRGNNQAFMRYL